MRIYLPQIGILSEEVFEALLQFERHRHFRQGVVVRGLDGAPVTVHVFDARPAVRDVLVESYANVRRQFLFDVFEKQMLGVKAAEAAKVEDMSDEQFEFL
jgi:hypothetical protein